MQRAFLFGIVGFGILLRVLYVATTPATDRAHDWDKHLHYVQYMMEHGIPPPASQGLEFYQPPAYYALAALWANAGEFLGMSDPLRTVPVLSLLFSFGLLFVALRLTQVVWKRKQWHESALFLALLTVLPGLVFFSSVINNDVLATFLSFLVCLLLFQWWAKASWQNALVLSTVLGTGIVTKGTVTLLLPIVWLCMWLRPKIVWSERVSMVLASVCIVGTFWLASMAPRLFVEDAPVVGGIEELNPGLRVPVTMEHFLFSPREVLRHPFNDPLNPVARNGMAFEYLFRSAFFGEYAFSLEWYSEVAHIILLCAIAGLLYMAYGMLRAARHPSPVSVPMFLVFFVLLCGMVAMRIVHPFSVFQDFRYIPLISVPATYFAVKGVVEAPRALRGLGFYLLWVLAACSAVFVLMLILKVG
jgi:hypothetical protein